MAKINVIVSYKSDNGCCDRGEADSEEISHAADSLVTLLKPYAAAVSHTTTSCDILMTLDAPNYEEAFIKGSATAMSAMMHAGMPDWDVTHVVVYDPMADEIMN